MRVKPRQKTVGFEEPRIREFVDTIRIGRRMKDVARIVKENPGHTLSWLTPKIYGSRIPIQEVRFRTFKKCEQARLIKSIVHQGKRFYFPE